MASLRIGDYEFEKHELHRKKPTQLPTAFLQLLLSAASTRGAHLRPGFPIIAHAPPWQPGLPRGHCRSESRNPGPELFDNGTEILGMDLHGRRSGPGGEENSWGSDRVLSQCVWFRLSDFPRCLFTITNETSPQTHASTLGR